MQESLLLPVAGDGVPAKNDRETLAEADIRLLTAGSVSPAEGLYLLARDIGTELGRLREMSSVPQQLTEAALIDALETRRTIGPAAATTLRDFYEVMQRLRSGVPADLAKQAFEGGLIILKSLQAIGSMELKWEGRRYYLKFDPEEEARMLEYGHQALGDRYDPKSENFALVNRMGELFLEVPNIAGIVPINQVASVNRYLGSLPEGETGIATTTEDGVDTWWVAYSRHNLVDLRFLEGARMEGRSGERPIQRIVLSLEEADEFVADMRRQLLVDRGGVR